VFVSRELEWDLCSCMLCFFVGQLFQPLLSLVVLSRQKCRIVCVPVGSLNQAGLCVCLLQRVFCFDGEMPGPVKAVLSRNGFRGMAGNYAALTGVWLT